MAKRKNYVEQVCSLTFRGMKARTYYLKLQVNKAARTCMPADYMVLGPNFRYLVECKQVDLRVDPKRTFAFDRLTQEQALVDFEARNPLNRSYVLLGFITGRLKDCHFFLLPIQSYLDLKRMYGKKSVPLEFFLSYPYLPAKRAILKGSVLDFTKDFL